MGLTKKSSGPFPRFRHVSGAKRTGVSTDLRNSSFHSTILGRIRHIVPRPSSCMWCLNNVLRIFAISFAILILLPGCGTRLAKKGMPFELDRVFKGLFLVETETAKDKGLRLVRNRDYHGAIDSFKMAVLENPEDFFGFNAIAVCYKNLGETEQAMQNYERAFELARSPEERAKVLSNIGNLYGTAGKHQVALGFYKEAQNESPQNPIYLVRIARTFVYLDELPRAAKVVKTAEDIIGELPKYERDEDRGLGHYLLAQVYLALEEEENLFNSLQKSVKANPERFVKRLSSDASDETNLFFTVRDDPRLRKLLRVHAGSAATR